MTTKKLNVKKDIKMMMTVRNGTLKKHKFRHDLESKLVLKRSGGRDVAVVSNVPKIR